MKGTPHSFLKATPLIALVCWYGAECMQNIMNKSLMQNPKHFLGSLALASTNTLVAALLDLVAIKFYFFPTVPVFTGPTRLVNRARVTELFVVSIAMFLGKNLTMAAFQYIPLSLSNTIKMTQPVFTVALGYFWLGKLPSGRVLLTLPIILLGAALVVSTDLSFNFVGFFAIFLATCMATGQNLYFKNSVRLETYPGQGRMVARMVLVHMIIAATAFVLSFPPALIEETRRHQFSEQHQPVQIPFFQILVGSVMNWFGSVAAYVFLATVDTALTHNIAKIGQRLMLIIISIIIFHRSVTFWNTFGIVIALFGVFLYSLASKHKPKGGGGGGREVLPTQGAHRV
jgi:drug/metabolite transporter (DMT)-like permease